MIKFNSVLLLIFFSYLKAESQALKTFKGNYENGKAIYTYYEKDYNRIYEGQFVYSKNTVNSYFKEYTLIKASGNYHNNKKQGKWTYTYSEISPIISATELVEGMYNNGKKVGKWTDIYSNHSKIIKKSIVNFINNQLTGHFIFQYNCGGGFISPYSNLYLEGDLDNDSKLTGLIRINYVLNKRDKYEIISKFRRGILTWFLERDLNTGEILNKIDHIQLADTIFGVTKIDSLLNLPDSLSQEKYLSFKNDKHPYQLFTSNEFISSQYTNLNILSFCLGYWNNDKIANFGDDFKADNPVALISYGEYHSSPIKFVTGIYQLIDY